MYSILILAIIFAEGEAKNRVLTPPGGIHKTAAELARLISLVRGYGVKETGLEDPDVSGLEKEEYTSTLTSNLDRNKDSKARIPIMALLQKNYDTYKGHKNPGFRLHIIRNPGVLEEYQKNHHAKLYKTSDANDDTGNQLNDWDLRRNAVFRFESSSSENALKSNANDNTMANNNPNSSENDKHNDAKNNYDIGKKDHENHNDVDVFIDNDEHDKRKKGREDESLKPDNAWDVITKKYSWDKGSKQRKDKKKSQKKITMDYDKVIKQEFDDERYDKTTKNWEGKKYKKIKDFDISGETKKNKKVKNTDWDVTPFKMKTLKTTKKWKSESNGEWDKVYVPKISSYYNNRPKNKKRGSFDGSGSFFGRTPIPYVGRQGIYVD